MSKATVLLTNKALMIARDAIEYSPGISIDILNIALDNVKNIVLLKDNLNGKTIYRLKIYFQIELESNALEIVLTDVDEEIGILLNDTLSLLN
jgi:hypothetical protein